MILNHVEWHIDIAAKKKNINKDNADKRKPPENINYLYAIGASRNIRTYYFFQLVQLLYTIKTNPISTTRHKTVSPANQIKYSLLRLRAI